MERQTQFHNFGFLAVPTADVEGQNFGERSKLMIRNSMIAGENCDVVDEDGEGEVSDSESSSASGCTNERNPKNIGRFEFEDELIRVEEGDREHETIKLSVVSGLSSWGLQTQIKEINRITYSGFRKAAKLQAFQIFAKSMEQSANVRYAWYGASKDQVMKIVSHGFCDPPNNGMFGRGVYLSPVDNILDSLQSTIADEDGVRHLILCCVLMGRMEQVPAGSQQSYPSSKDFDSGVDNIAKPRKYIVWGSNMNTHILPKFVVSIGNVDNTQVARSQQVSVAKPPLKKPNSPWLPFPTLISELARFLQPQSINLIKKYHNDHKERKLSRIELIQRVRHIAGDELLASVIKSYRQKQLNRSSESISNASNKSLEGGRKNCACWRRDLTNKLDGTIRSVVNTREAILSFQTDHH